MYDSIFIVYLPPIFPIKGEYDLSTQNIFIMKLKTIFLSAAFLLVAGIANAFTIRYSNNDSQNYTMEVRSNGSTQKIEFTSSTTGSSSVQTSASEVEIKTSCGWVKVKDGAKISIKNGCIKIE